MYLGVRFSSATACRLPSSRACQTSRLLPETASAHLIYIRINCRDYLRNSLQRRPQRTSPPLAWPRRRRRCHYQR